MLESILISNLWQFRMYLSAAFSHIRLFSTFDFSETGWYLSLSIFLGALEDAKSCKLSI